MKDKFWIIDGHNLIHRFYHAQFRPLSSPDGEPTKATWLFTKYLLKLLREQRPMYLALTMDCRREHCWRRDIYPEYKGNREPGKEDLIIQLKRVVEIAETIGVSVVRLKRFEADDVIATLARSCVSDDVHVVVVSRDKDLMQLLDDPRITCYDPLDEQAIDTDWVRGKFGVGPEQVVDFLSMTGDTADNIKGVGGVGEVGAAEILNRYGSTKAFLRDGHGHKHHQKVVVWASLGKYKLNRRLIHLRTDAPLKLNVDELNCSRIDVNQARPIFRLLGFTRWA